MTAEFNLVNTILLAYWISDAVLVLLGLPHVLRMVRLPDVVSDLLMYGKIKGRNRASNFLTRLLEVPKSWFTYFYVYGLFVSLYMSFITCSGFLPILNEFNIDQIPGTGFLRKALEDRTSVVDGCSVMIVCIMMLIQHIRRIYECYFVSVYSKGTMNVFHCLMAFLLYSTVQLIALMDGPKLDDYRSLKSSHMTLESDLATNLTAHWNKLIGIALFIWASAEHHRSHAILGNLRKDKSGQKILHRQHVIPRGGLFEYLSAPHMVCEILIYISMGFVMFHSWAFLLGPVLFVLSNKC